jgi:hypothetical protein
MKRLPIIPAILFLLLAASCKPSVKPEKLYGTWKYIKLENPVIIWSDTVLLRGKFSVDGDKMNINQTLAGGKTHQFPFYVSELTDKRIIFETHGVDGSKVTAVKE